MKTLKPKGTLQQQLEELEHGYKIAYSLKTDDPQIRKYLIPKIINDCKILFKEVLEQKRQFYANHTNIHEELFYELLEEFTLPVKPSKETRQ